MKNFFQLRDNRPLYCLLATAVTGATVAWAQTRAERPAPQMIPIISDYSRWKLVNQAPAPMDPAVAQLCIAPPPPAPLDEADLSKTAVMGSGGPHKKKWINVFVNPIGEAAMMTAKAPQFPVGTIIVKQKLAMPTGKGTEPNRPLPGQKPELLTIMMKREANYDVKNGDWEYMVTDGPGRKVSARGQLPSCQNCHRAYASTDYVVRSYLPASIEEALRDDETAGKK